VDTEPGILLGIHEFLEARGQVLLLSGVDPAVCVVVERSVEKTLRHTTAMSRKKTVG